MRCLGGAFEPDRRTSNPPAPDVTGARLRASRQIKNEIAAITTNAAIAIRTALLRLSELEPAAFEVTFGVTGAVV